jgi:allophanate hydrolase subunit 1
MKTQEVVRQQAVIRQLIRRATHEVSIRDLEMQAHWGKYVCVLTSGYVENIVRNIYGAYIEKTAHTAQTKKYAKRQLEGIQNPKSEKLIGIASSFDDKWGRDLEDFMNLNFRKEAINSIMSNRHLIAHGRSSGITLAKVDQYFVRASEIAVFIEIQCGL